MGSIGICSGAQVSSEPRQVEITAIEFEDQWYSTSDSTFPKQAVQAFPKYAREELKDHPFGFIWVDLDGEGTKEIIVADPTASGSGGQAYFVLRKVGSSWRRIAEFQGGFVLSGVEGQSRFYNIISYYRSGDTYQNTYHYKNGRYSLKEQVLLPSVVSRSCWWNSFWQRLNGLQRAVSRYDMGCSCSKFPDTCSDR